MLIAVVMKVLSDKGGCEVKLHENVVYAGSEGQTISDVHSDDRINDNGHSSSTTIHLYLCRMHNNDATCPAACHPASSTQNLAAGSSH
jgi:hypothetical protein